MTFDLRVKGRVKITMEGFVKELLEDCKEVLGVSPTPGRSDLFTVNDISSDPVLTQPAQEYLHSITAKLLYLSKRSRPDILTEVLFLTKRVTKPLWSDRLYRAYGTYRTSSRSTHSFRLQYTYISSTTS